MFDMSSMGAAGASEMGEDEMRAGLLEKLMGMMDGRIAGDAMPEHAQKSSKPAVDVQVVLGQAGKRPANPDDDPELDDDMRNLIKQRQGY